MAETLNWLLVGAGDIARKRVAAALCRAPGSRLDAVCSRNADRAASVAGEFGARATTDYEEALADPQIDAVYLATPVDLHVAQTVLAIRAGKHVLVEKPLGLNFADTLPAVEQAQRSNVTAGCAYYRRCFPSYVYARDLLKSGALGQLLSVRMDYASWFSPAADDPKYWRVQRSRSGGGPLMDMGSHMLDLTLDLAGPPVTVAAELKASVQGYEVEDHASFLLSFNTGATAQGSFFWNSKTWSHRFEIVGSEGRLSWDPFDSGVVTKIIGREHEEIVMPNAANVHLPLIEDFVSAARDGRAPIATIAEAARVNELLDTIYARGGRS